MVAMSGMHLNPAAQDLKFEELRWIQRVRQGDEVALTALIERHRTRLLRVAANILHDAHEAEDVAQESFLKGFKEIANLRDDRSFSGYLYRICVRLCMDRLRSRRAEPLEFDRVVPSDGPNVENKVLVQKLLSQLTPDLRTTVVLREVEQLSYDEIAIVMKVPVGTVRSRLHTARERLREMWIQEMGE